MHSVGSVHHCHIIGTVDKNLDAIGDVHNKLLGIR
jgi:hypothetical protein